MMLNASHIFPHNTPVTKEAYYYRMIFERFFPQVPKIYCVKEYNVLSLLDNLSVSNCKFSHIFKQNSARLTVPGGASIACSTAKAVEWDSSWSNNLDPSGRAALGVHNSAYEKQLSSTVNQNAATSIIDNVPRIMEVGAPQLTIRS